MIYGHVCIVVFTYQTYISGGNLSTYTSYVCSIDLCRSQSFSWCPLVATGSNNSSFTSFSINDHLPQDWLLCLHGIRAHLKTGCYACMVSGHTSSTTRPYTTMHGGSLCTVVKNQVQATLYPWLILMYRRQHCTSSNHPSMHSVLLLQFMCIPSLHSVLLLQLIVFRYHLNHLARYTSEHCLSFLLGPLSWYPSSVCFKHIMNVNVDWCISCLGLHPFGHPSAVAATTILVASSATYFVWISADPV